ADPELRLALPRPGAACGDDARDRADDHRRLAGGVRARRRVVDLHGRRVARRALRAHRRGHRGGAPDPDESCTRFGTMTALGTEPSPAPCLFMSMVNEE